MGGVYVRRTFVIALTVVLVTAGASMILYGLWLWSTAAALIIGGAIITTIGLVIEAPPRQRRNTSHRDAVTLQRGDGTPANVRNIRGEAR